MPTNKRDDFSAATKEALARRVGLHCSNPACWRITSGPADDPNRAVSTGVAAHITAASPDGPRYDPGLTPEQRGGIDNGIWLCQNHAHLVDHDEERYTVALLREWKTWAEEEARREVEGDRALGRAYRPPPPPDPDTLPDPGPKQPGWHLPFVRNALFTGREDPLKALAQALLHGEEGRGGEGRGDRAPTLITQAVQGMGGVGKTQLAVEFAYRYGRYFRGVHWLDARDPGGLEAQVADCGREMGLPNWPDKQPEQVARTLNAWAETGPRLVVLDNLEEPRAAAEWLARLAGGAAARILITARRSSWPRDLGLVPLRLEVFSPEESLAFLRRYLDPSRAADAELAALAERLGRLPLALKLAGCYLEGHSRLKVPDYVNKLADALADRSMEAQRDDQGRPWSDQDRDLLACFMLSWERVTDAAARRVFALAGWCAPNQPIPPKVLERAAELDAEACDGAAGLLAGLGLVEWEPDEPGPNLHPLLAEFGRTLEGDAALAAVAKALARLSYEALETGLPAEFAPLRAHVEAAARAEAAVPSGGSACMEQAGTLWNNLGYHWRDLADLAGAREAYERALGIFEKMLGPQHPNVATLVNNLGLVRQDLGDLARARAAFERALAILQVAYGEEHPQVAAAHNNLGLVLKDLGDLAGARAEIERALAIWQAAYEEERPQVATAHNNLGLVLKDLGDLAGARAAYERALRIDERIYSPDHPNVAIRVNNLGLVLQDLGDLAGARVAFERALRIGERVYGPDHPNVATRVNNLGMVMKDLGDLAGARAAFERALGIDERVYGPDHPKVATDVNNLGGVLQDLGDLTGARAAFERALGIDERVYGPDHPKVAIRVNNLGLVLQDLGDLAGARAALERALAIWERSLPAGHPTIQIARGNLASLGPAGKAGGA